MKKILQSWKIWLENQTNPVPNYSSFENFISDVEKSTGLDPETQKDASATIASIDKEITGNIKSSCRCVDRSESKLSVQEIKKIINDYYKDQIFSTEEMNDTCDEKTQRAIMQFQANTGAEQDGCVGDETEGKMVEAGLLKKLTITKGSNYSSSSDTPTSSTDDNVVLDPNVSVSSATGTGGVTITVIKANQEGPKPNSRLKLPNFQGYGRDTSNYDVVNKKYQRRSNNRENDAYFVNGINVGDYLRNKPGIAVLSGRPHKQFGTKILAVALAAAGLAAQKYVSDQGIKRSGGESRLADVSLGRCINKAERDKDPSVPCIMGGWGKQIGHYRWGHQSGLEADMSFYKKSGPPKSWKPADVGFKNFDYERNCAFMENLLQNEKVEMIIIGTKVLRGMQSWIKKNGLQSQFSNILSSAKIGPDSKGGHDNHYHIRLHIPSGSPNMKQYKKMSKNQKSAVGQKGSKTLASLPKERSKYSFILGTVDGKIIASQNEKSEFYGASIQKPITALAQLIQYKNDAKNKLNNKEVEMLLSYSKGSEGSNRVNRRISPGNRAGSYQRQGSIGVGKIDPAILRQILSVFDIRNQKFTYGKSNNKQSSLDYYKFLSGLERMTTGRSKNKIEKAFAAKYESEMKQIISALKKRRYASHIKNGFQSAGITNFWGKGGRASGSLNYGIVVSGKYVIVIYTRFSEEKYKTPGYNKTGAGGEHTKKMFDVIKYLVSKMR